MRGGKRLSLLFTAFLLFTTPIAAFAENSASLLLGPAFRSAGGTGLGFELKAGHRFIPLLMTQLYYWRVSSGADLSAGTTSISSSQSMTSFGFEGLYSFLGSSWSAGAKLGLTKGSVSGSSTDGITTVKIDDSSTSLSLAPTLIYEVPVGLFMLGGEAAYLYSFSSSVPKALSLMAQARVRF